MKKQATKTAKQVKNNVEPELKELGQRIRQLRLNMGYTSAEKFAIDHKLSRVSYTKCETGSNMTYMSLRRLLKIFDLSVAEFFAEGFKK